MRTAEELVKEIQDHFKRIYELLDYLDEVLPEHGATLKVENADH
jgi:hypothetical protein